MYTLYGTECSLYSGKARSYLRKKGLVFNEVTSSLKVYKKIIIPRTGVRYIPVLQTPDDKVLQDTTVIIDELEARHPDHSVYPSTPKQRLVALLLETYGDEWLVIPAMHYRWNFPEVNQPFIYGEFGATVFPGLPAFLQRYVGRKFGDKFRGMVPRLGIYQQTIPAIEQSYKALLDDLNRHFEQHDFILGSKPCIADFGLIAPLYAHLYRDPAPGKLMRERAANVVAWVERMMSDQTHLQQGQWQSNDHIPTTLIPILRRMAKEQLPVLRDTDQRLTAWREANPNIEEIERVIGEHKFNVEGVSAKRMVIPYSLWMYQRAVRYYQSLDQSSDVDRLLQQCGFENALPLDLQNRLARVNNKLVFSE